MDITTLRIGVTVLSLLLFLGIVAWAWARRRQPDFDAAARLPFGDEALEGSGALSNGSNGSPVSPVSPRGQ